MAAADQYTDAVVHRATDFFDPAVQWQRGLWDVGLVLSLRELVEASDGARVGALSVKSVKWLAESVRERLPRDPGCGSPQERKALDALLGRDLTSGGVNHGELRLWTDVIEREYLARWAAAVRDEDRPSRERAARALASHMLDADVSVSRLGGWLRSVLESNTPVDAAGIFDAAADLLAGGDSAFETMILFAQPPRQRMARPDEWREASEVSAWLRRHGFDAPRQHGGLVLSLMARDPHGAADRAADVVDRLLARARVGTRDKMEFLRHAYVAGYGSPIDLRRARRAEVRALEREDKVLLWDQQRPVDAALELLSHLNAAPAPVAVAAGWSSIEALLSGPGDDDKVITAERLAYLVACSWPRAELTTLAWARQRAGGDHLSDELASLPTNRDRADRILRSLRAGDEHGCLQERDRLAQKRIDKLIRAPRDVLVAIQRRAAGSFRRLYRQRNLVLHGGQMAGAALRPALRTAAPLVGAGLDRLTHAALTRDIPALDLASRARVEVERAGTAGAPSLTGLLE